MKHGSRLIRLAIVLGGLVVSLLAPSTAGAVRSEFFGIVQGPTLDNQDLQGLAAARVRTDRFLLNWGWVQPTQSSFRWDSSDRFMGELASHGIRPFPTLWGNPPWVGGGSSTPPIGGTQGEDAWRAFLRAVVRRYGRGGSYWGTPYHQRYGAGAESLPIRSWQIWNEPNLQKFFAPNVSPARYARLLQISHDPIKNQNPAARIVLAGMPGNGDMKAWNFLDGLYSVAGIKSKFDAVALHPYAHDVDHQRVHIQKVRRVMRNRGDAATPLWISELAWGSDPPDSFGINKGLQGQATMLERSFKMILSHRKVWKVERLFWYHWRDPQNNNARCSFCASAGLLKPDRTPKPALPVYKGFTAETTPPQVSITGGPSEGAFIKDSTPTFTFVSNERGSTFECRFGTQPFAPCSSPFTRGRPLVDGARTFYVRAIDAPGNVSAVKSRSFTVDTQAPTTRITSGPVNGSTSSNRSPSFSFVSSETDSIFKCQLDGSGFADCSSPFSASQLADGSHTFQVRATDRAGNQGPAASRTWTVDGTPNVAITAGPQDGAFTNDATPRFSFTSGDSGASFGCRIGGGFTPCTSPFTTSRLSDGPHTFTVRATDTARHSYLASRRFTVDTAAPAVRIKGPSKAKTTNRRASATFIVSASEHAGLRCRVDSSGFKDCSSRYTTPKLSAGIHHLGVQATDRAGNVGTERKTFKIARKPPTGNPPAGDRSHARCHRVAATLVGTPHDDRLRGTKGPDVIVAFEGDDRIYGRGGGDLICARRGDDRVAAGWGDDQILGGRGSDDISGGAGRDIIRGGIGLDACVGAPPGRRLHCEDGS